MFQLIEQRTLNINLGALIITYTILVVPYDNYSVNGARNPVLTIEAPRPNPKESL